MFFINIFKRKDIGSINNIFMLFIPKKVITNNHRKIITFL